MEEDETLQGETERAKVETHATPEIGRQISVSEFLCHCCYDILVNPTTLNCGHSFCRHCLALWWVSSKKSECPECREKWEGFPKVNILLRWVYYVIFWISKTTEICCLVLEFAADFHSLLVIWTVARMFKSWNLSFSALVLNCSITFFCMELRGGLVGFVLGFGSPPLLNFFGDGEEGSFFSIETLASFNTAGCFLILLEWSLIIV